VGLGRVVLRSKEYLAAIRPAQDALMLSTMLFADEIVPRAAIEEFAADEAEVSPKELAIAEQLVGSLSAEWDPDRYKDTYRERVLALVQAKAEGREIVEHAVPEPAARVDDLMAALEASLAAATKQATTKKSAAAKKPRRAAARKTAS
jgi:DNA end-binding protein Ku